MKISLGKLIRNTTALVVIPTVSMCYGCFEQIVRGVENDFYDHAPAFMQSGRYQRENELKIHMGKKEIDAAFESAKQDYEGTITGKGAGWEVCDKEECIIYDKDGNAKPIIQ
ncbi:MAG: hypothetical protein PVJ67_01390 [Candidatus Pacearchaeota archaeon]